MRLTPLDIRKQEFGRHFRGFDPDEVQAFLQMVSSQWEEMLAEIRQMEQRLQEAENRLNHYQKVEEALEEALRIARDNAQKSLNVAEVKAGGILLEAERRAEAMQREAVQARDALRREVETLTRKQEEVVVRLKSFLQSELDLLGRYDQHVRAAAYTEDEPIETEQPVAGQSLEGEYLGRMLQGNAPAEASQKQRFSKETATPHFGGEMPSPADVERILSAYQSNEGAGAASGAGLPDAAASPLHQAGRSVDAGVPRFTRADSRPEADERSRTGWVVRPVVESGAPPIEADAADVDEEPLDLHEPGAESDEIEHIRRILKDLD